MKVLISGGYGFIGSYMVRAFLDRGVEVGILSRKSPAYLDYLTEQVSFYECDITNEMTFELKEDYDLFIHLAAANDVHSRNAKTALDVTTLGTRHCLDFCHKNGIGKFIYFSTFQVYGTDTGFVDETTEVNCRNDYSLTHYFAEQYVRMYHKNCGMDYVIVRPTNVFGCFADKRIDRWSLVPNCFCREAFDNQRITLLSSGKQLRDFVSLEDVAGITCLLCEDFEKHRNSIMNIAGGRSISILDVARTVKSVYEEKFARECELVIKSEHPESSTDFCVSTDRAESSGYRYSGSGNLRDAVEGIFSMLAESQE